MKYCKYCGTKIADDAELCPECGKLIGTKVSTDGNPKFSDKRAPNGTKARLNKRRALLLVVLGVIIVIIALIVVNSGKCKASGCNNKAVSSMDYCYSHKCAVASCNNRKYALSNYCYSHYLLYDDDATSSYKTYVYSSELKISNVELSSSKNYTVVEGTLTNNSEQTVSYVKIKPANKKSSPKQDLTKGNFAGSRQRKKHDNKAAAKAPT